LGREQQKKANREKERQEKAGRDQRKQFNDQKEEGEQGGGGADFKNLSARFIGSDITEHRLGEDKKFAERIQDQKDKLETVKETMQDMGLKDAEDVKKCEEKCLNALAAEQIKLVEAIAGGAPSDVIEAIQSTILNIGEEQKLLEDCLSTLSLTGVHTLR
jgi:hypothetical protein